MSGRNEDLGQADLLAGELERLTLRLREMGARKIVLFGSYAKGRADACTDLDILAVLESELPFVERTGDLYRLLAPRVALDLLVYTPEEWLAMNDRPFIRNAVAEGRVLYEAPGC